MAWLTHSFPHSFLQELHDADDPFETIASMFSRGIFTRSALQP